jgi:hypothetical protein
MAAPRVGGTAATGAAATDAATGKPETRAGQAADEPDAAAITGPELPGSHVWIA